MDQRTWIYNMLWCYYSKIIQVSHYAYLDFIDFGSISVSPVIVGATSKNEAKMRKPCGDRRPNESCVVPRLKGESLNWNSANKLVMARSSL